MIRILLPLKGFNYEPLEIKFLTFFLKILTTIGIKVQFLIQKKKKLRIWASFSAFVNQKNTHFLQINLLHIYYSSITLTVMLQ